MAAPGDRGSFDRPAGIRVGEWRITDALAVVLRSDGFADLVFEPVGDSADKGVGGGGDAIAEALTADEAEAAATALAECAARLRRMTARS
jgi:hypothetical protein